MNSFHPISVLMLFASVIIAVMMGSSPIFTGVIIIGGIMMLILTRGTHGILKELSGYLLIWLVISLMNPLFVHRGATPLFFINGRAITLEATLYGMCSSMRLVGALIWCRSFSLIMTNDKIYCLTGKLSPRITAMLTTAVRFIPDMLSQAKKIGAYTKLSGEYESEFKRLSAVFSALVTWTIESGMQTADSMTARGFELGGRTSYSRFRFTFEDSILTALSIISLAFVLMLGGRISVEFYPEILSRTEKIPLAVTSASTASSYLFPIIFSVIISRKRGRRI